MLTEISMNQHQKQEQSGSSAANFPNLKVVKSAFNVPAARDRHAALTFTY